MLSYKLKYSLQRTNFLLSEKKKTFSGDDLTKVEKNIYIFIFFVHKKDRNRETSILLYNWYEKIRLEDHTLFLLSWKFRITFS